MKIRVSPQAQPPKAKTLSRTQWEQLLKLACLRAETSRDPRALLLKMAIGTGQAERVLREMSVISEADLIREFGSPNT